MQKVPSSEIPQSRKDGALARLGVTKEQLASSPNITSILKESRGGIKLAFKAMRFSETAEIVKFLQKYDATPEGDRDRVPLEAIAIAAGINVRHLWGEIMLAIREQSVHSVKMIAVSAHPEIIKKRVEFAQLPGGYRDRDALDTMLGALPSTKGISILNKIFTGTKEEDDEDASVRPEITDDVDFVFPDCELIQEAVQPMRQRALTEGK